MRTASVRLTALVVADAFAIVALLPDPHLIGRLGAPRAWIEQVGADAAAARFAGALLWLAACWLAVGLACVLATAIPGAGGRAAARVVSALLPGAVARLIAGASGLGLLVVPVAASAALSPTPAAAAAAPAPAWPTNDPLPAPAWPVAPAPHSAAPATTPQHVVVKPGDTLWSIAAHHLPHTAYPQRVARSWPRWYAANRAVIGADPDHIVAGQVLTQPAEESNR